MTQTPIARRVVLVGEYDLTDRSELAKLFGALSPDGPATIDVSAVTFFDSTFLSELAKLYVRFKGHAISIEGATANALRTLRTVGFDQIFDIREVVQAPVSSGEFPAALGPERSYRTAELQTP